MCRFSNTQNLFLLQVFEAAQTSVYPFELNISSDIDTSIEEQEQTVLNAMSHEQLSISVSRDRGYRRFKAIIERSAEAAAEK